MARLRIREFEDAIQAWCQPLIAAEFPEVIAIMENQTAEDNANPAPTVGGTPPRPSRTYVGIDVISRITAGRGADKAPEEVDGVWNLPKRVNYELTVRFQGYGEDSADAVGIISDAIDNDGEREPLLLQGIVPAMRLTEVQEFHERLNNTEWERRAFIDIMFRACAVVSNGEGIIEIVKLEGTLTTDKGSVKTINKTVNEDG